MIVPDSDGWFQRDCAVDGHCNSHENTEPATQQSLKDDTPIINPYDSGTEGSDTRPVNPYPACISMAQCEPSHPPPVAEGNGPLLCDESQGPVGQQTHERGGGEVKLNGSGCVNGQEGPTPQEAPKKDSTSEADPGFPAAPEQESLKDGQ